ncbi:MAG: amidohydrolase [Syntrophomonadaceae bacterium]|jgi:imidazolonepropionase-like amidohydrolase
MIAFKGGTILTMEGQKTIPHGIILVEGPIIRSVGSDIEIPHGCQIIDATGCYITPGFIDAHTHLGLEEEIYRVEGDDVNEINEPLTPQLMAADGINFYDLGFCDALRGGVTRSLCMPGSANIIGGQAALIKHYALEAMQMIDRNPWGVKAALGENPKRVYGERKKSPVTRMASASLLREALYTASQAMNNKKLSLSERFKWEPVMQVLKKEQPLLLHVHRADDILTALRIKDEFDFNLILQHGTEAFLVAEELRRRQVPVCLGPLLVNRAKVELKAVSFKNAAKLAELGVQFCLVTDHPVVPIEQLRVCAALAAREGLGEEQALEAVTINAATILGVADYLGSISVGKRADLALFDGHPLEYRSRLRQVMVDGLLWGGNRE